LLLTPFSIHTTDFKILTQTGFDLPHLNTGLTHAHRLKLYVEMTALSCANKLHFLTFRILLVASMDKLSR
jgi:hypothetical protein